ncbi:hypothetical protein NSA56_01810 [Oceanobacillus caeni]|uniref:hypothetical protein n=1 Tax=Oceanobacillus caeni TaxID=405946 RepID=UPI00214A3358|nr:hypothetical protein [Oceanobacillus caeni]MCR1833132.1 hypothetical protein [Oceanobacillus caeni]
MGTENFDLTIGMAHVTIGGEPVPRQADAAVFSAEPIITDIDLYTAPNFDKMVEGWNVTCTIVVDVASLEGYKMALAGVEEGTDGSLSDGKGLQRMRGKAQEVVIHPVDNGIDTSMDIIIHKAIPVGTFERTFGKEVTGYEIQLQGLHKSGDYRLSNNYFQIGGEPEVLP